MSYHSPILNEFLFNNYNALWVIYAKEGMDTQILENMEALKFAVFWGVAVWVMLEPTFQRNMSPPS
jgi:hypothetical protein